MGVIAAVILAAGAGSRFDGPTHKLLSRLAGRRVIDRAIEPALNASIGPVIVVSGAVDLALDHRDDLIAVNNPDWQRGQLSSLMVGITEAARHGAEAIAVALGDQPYLTPQAWRQVITSPSPIGVATYGGRRGHPVYLEAITWPLLPEAGDEGARSLLRHYPDLVTEIPCPGDPSDIDTAEDLTDAPNDD